MVRDGSKVDSTIRAVLSVVARMRRLVRIDKCENFRLNVTLRWELGGMNCKQERA
jgi:hypothetical protein